MTGFNLYDYPKRFELSVRKLENNLEVSEENRKDIISFCKVKLAKGCTHCRVVKLMQSLKIWALQFNKPFRQATKDDLLTLVGDLESNQHYAEHSKHDLKVILKMFYKWLKGNDEQVPPEIKWLVPRMRNESSKLPEDLLTEDEVLKIAHAANNPRDRAFILILYESGCRIGELLTLQIKHIKFDQYGGILRVTGKTGDRRVRIISSAPALAAWLEMHAEAEDPEAPLWLSRATNSSTRRKGVKFLDHRSACILVKMLAQKSGIKKRVHPHLFRHSRATSLAGKLTEAQMKEYFGWVQGSEMAATYVHLSGRDVDNALLKLHGLAKADEETEDKMKVRLCVKCKEHNSPIAKFCIRCGLPLNQDFMDIVENERKNSDNVMNKLMGDKDFKELMLRKIMEMGLEKSLIS